LTKPPKGTSLADFTRFDARLFDEKKGHYKKSQRGVPICGEFPTEPNLTKTGV